MALFGSAPYSHKRSINGICTRHSRGTRPEQPDQCFVQCGSFHARIENDLGHFDDVGGSVP